MSFEIETQGREISGRHMLQALASCEPFINRFDWLEVDFDCHSIGNEGLYLVSDDSGTFVRRVEVMPSGVYIQCGPQAEPVLIDDCAPFRVLGHVRFIAKGMKV